MISPYTAARMLACALGLVVATTGATRSASFGQTATTPSVHDKAFWQRVASANWAVPAGESSDALVQELSRSLGSPDAELRDDIAYTGLVAWIYRQKIVAEPRRRALLADWTANLTAGIGERDTDSVFRRSFSALALGVLVVLDNESPYLEKAEFDRTLDAAFAYLASERDTRGFEAGKGWIHSVAHTADLLKFLGRSRHLEVRQQEAILNAISAKVSGIDTVLTHGEDERLARAVLSVAARPDFDAPAFTRWAEGLAPARLAGTPTPAQLARGQNRRNLAVALYAVLSTDARNLATVQSARDIILARLKTFM